MKQLLLITTPYFFEEEASVLTELFKRGLEILHIRKPQSDLNSVEKLLNEIDSQYHSSIVLHEHFQLASRYNLKGIHLNQRNRDIPKGFTGRISRSCHTLEELQHISEYNYVFLSPIFSSISKKEYESNFPIETLLAASNQKIIHRQVIALGGIDTNTIPLLTNIPFGGVAVLGGVWGVTKTALTLPGISQRFTEIQNCLNQIE